MFTFETFLVFQTALNVTIRDANVSIMQFFKNRCWKPEFIISRREISAKYTGLLCNKRLSIIVFLTQEGTNVSYAGWIGTRLIDVCRLKQSIAVIIWAEVIARTEVLPAEIYMWNKCLMSWFIDQTSDPFHWEWTQWCSKKIQNVINKTWKLLNEPEKYVELIIPSFIHNLQSNNSQPSSSRSAFDNILYFG